jgi:hypothetical protein
MIFVLHTVGQELTSGEKPSSLSAVAHFQVGNSVDATCHVTFAHVATDELNERSSGPTRQRPDVTYVWRCVETFLVADGYFAEISVNNPRSVFLNRDSFPLSWISHRMAE